MTTTSYPNSSALLLMLLENVRRHRISRLSGMNPYLFDVEDEEMYIFIKNLSPAQLSNDNPDIWRIQLPKKEEFDEIKRSDKMFILLGYDFRRKVYTSWNPYWCKQRLNVAESCSLYSRLSLQKKVETTQKIERMSLNNDGDVVCIPAALIGNYLKSIREYYPEETIYVPQGSSIRKREQEEALSIVSEDSSPYSPEIYNLFVSCYDTDKFKNYLIGRGISSEKISEYIRCLIYAFECSPQLGDNIYLYKTKFLECKKLSDVIHVINRFCWQLQFRNLGESWRLAMQATLKLYLQFVELQAYSTQNIQIRLNSNQKELIDESSADIQEVESSTHTKKDIPSSKEISFELDDYGKLKELDYSVIESVRPLVKDIDFPDWEEIIAKIVELYPQRVTENMNLVDWMNLLEKTNWKKRRSRKTTARQVKKENTERSGIKITQSDGSIIQKDNSKETFVYAIEHNYPDLIIGIDFGQKIISEEPFLENDGTYKEQEIILGDYYLYTNLSNNTKIEILRKISEELELNWTVEFISKSYSTSALERAHSYEIKRRNYKFYDAESEEDMNLEGYSLCENAKKLLSLPLNALPFSTRVRHILRTIGVHSFIDIPQLSYRQLKDTNNCGNKSIYEIRKFLSKFSLKFGMRYRDILSEMQKFSDIDISSFYHLGLKIEDGKQSSTEENSSDYSKYINKIKNINQAIIRGEVIIAKPALLVAVIDGINAHVFNENRFILNTWLEDRYNKLMRTYAKNSQFDNTTTIDKPFWHLVSDGFWHLKLKDDSIIVTQTPSKTWLKYNIDYAYFDEELWTLLIDKTLRTQIRDYIINNKLA